MLTTKEKIARIERCLELWREIDEWDELDQVFFGDTDTDDDTECYLNRCKERLQMNSGILPVIERPRKTDFVSDQELINKHLSEHIKLNCSASDVLVGEPLKFYRPDGEGTSYSQKPTAELTPKKLLDAKDWIRLYALTGP